MTAVAPARRAPPPAVSAAEWVPEESLELWSDNPRDNDGEPVRKVAESIRRFGFVSPIVVWGSRQQMVAGHTRLKAYRALLQEDPTFVPVGSPAHGLVPVRYHEFRSDEEASAFAIADNRLSYEADWDYTKLVPMLSKLGGVDESLLALSGFDGGELDALLRSQWSPEFEDRAPIGSFKGPPNATADNAEDAPHTNTGVHTLAFDPDAWAIVLRVVELQGGSRETNGDIAQSLVAFCREAVG